MSDKLLIVLEQKWETCARVWLARSISIFLQKKLKLKQFSTTGKPHFFLINISFWKKTKNLRQFQSNNLFFKL